jgi:hypothetical protein
MLLLLAAPASAQDSRKMQFLFGVRGKQLDVKVEYADPYTVDPRLKDSLVLPVYFRLLNVSAQPVAFNYYDLRLNLGGKEPLAAVDADAVSQEFRLKRVPGLLRFLDDNSTAFQPKRIAAVLKARQLKDGDIPPGRTKEGLVFFVRPPVSDPSSHTGAMWLEANGQPPQMLETKDVAVKTRVSETTSLSARFRQAWSMVFGAPPAFDKSYALVVGIGNYQHLPPLSSPAADVQKMKAYLEAQGFDEVVTPSEENVTIDQLRQPQKYFANKLGPNDRFLFYYSGHGVEANDRGKPRGYLPLKDEVPGGHQRSIPMDSLVVWMKGLKPEHLLVIIDACFSGLAIDGVEMRGIKLADPKVDREALNRLSMGSARFLLTAGTAGQESFGGRPEWKGGSMFTDTLIKGLQSGADPYHNKIVTTRALYVWLIEAVFREASKLDRNLTPLFVDLSPKTSLGDFVFVQ